MQKLTYSLVILLIICSCNEKVSFEKAQPAHAKQLGQIPTLYHGNYIDLEDSSSVKIMNNMIVQYEKEPFIIAEPIDSILVEIDLEPGIDIVTRGTDFIEINFWGISKEKLEFRNDSLFGSINIPQVIFSFEEGDILKEKSDCYFFNVKCESGYYLRKVKLDEDVLTVSKIERAEDVVSLSSISRNSDRKGKGLKPNKRQFNRINRNSFNISREFKKVE